MVLAHLGIWPGRLFSQRQEICLVAGLGATRCLGESKTSGCFELQYLALYKHSSQRELPGQLRQETFMEVQTQELVVKKPGYLQLRWGSCRSGAWGVRVVITKTPV